jgi:hypothetical protein
MAIGLACVDCLEEVDEIDARRAVLVATDAAGHPIKVCFEHYKLREDADERSAERRLAEAPNGL